METYSLRRGSGNRASFNGTVVTVFGATGAFGNSLIPALARIGCQIILPYRRNSNTVVKFKNNGDLGQFQFVVRIQMNLKSLIKFKYLSIFFALFAF